MAVFTATLTAAFQLGPDFTIDDVKDAKVTTICNTSILSSFPLVCMLFLSYFLICTTVFPLKNAGAFIKFNGPAGRAFIWAVL